MTFHDGMRLLAGVPDDQADVLGRAPDADPASGWLSVDAGRWLEGILAQLGGVELSFRFASSIYSSI